MYLCLYGIWGIVFKRDQMKQTLCLLKIIIMSACCPTILREETQRHRWKYSSFSLTARYPWWYRLDKSKRFQLREKSVIRRIREGDMILKLDCTWVHSSREEKWPPRLRGNLSFLSVHEIIMPFSVNKYPHHTLLKYGFCLFVCLSYSCLSIIKFCSVKE